MKTRERTENKPKDDYLERLAILLLPVTDLKHVIYEIKLQRRVLADIQMVRDLNKRRYLKYLKKDKK